jgi:antitoxin (DNA-binding transcriptional repressor) of toxin-antitoxin stability system
MDEVAISGQPITITKHGRPIAQLVPAPSTSGALLGDLHGTVSIGGDVVTPLESDWPAPKG